MKLHCLKTLGFVGIFGVSTIIFSCAESKPVAETAKTSQDTEMLMRRMDTNKDGKLSKDEVKGPLQQDFSKVDTNDDGFLSKEELEKAPKPKRQGPPNGQQPNRQ